MSATDVALILKLYDITTFAVDIGNVKVVMLGSLPCVKLFTFCFTNVMPTFLV